MIKGQEKKPSLKRLKQVPESNSGMTQVLKLAAAVSNNDEDAKGSTGKSSNMQQKMGDVSREMKFIISTFIYLLASPGNAKKKSNRNEGFFLKKIF